MVETYPNDVKVIFKHNPLGFHKRAMPIAKASMAAHMQGKFWEFHDLVFQRKAYDDAKLEAIATELGLDGICGGLPGIAQRMGVLRSGRALLGNFSTPPVAIPANA